MIRDKEAYLERRRLKPSLYDPADCMTDIEEAEHGERKAEKAHEAELRLKQYKVQFIKDHGISCYMDVDTKEVSQVKLCLARILEETNPEDVLKTVLFDMLHEALDNLLIDCEE